MSYFEQAFDERQAFDTTRKDEYGRHKIQLSSYDRETNGFFFSKLMI